MEKISNAYECRLNNKKVFDFYQKTKIDFEYVNVIFLDILEKLMDTSLNANLASILLEKFDTLNGKVETFGNSVIKSHQDITAIFNNNLREYKKEYSEELNRIINSNNTSFIGPLIEQTNNTLFEKSAKMIGDIIPRENKVMTEILSEQAKGFNNSIIDETKVLLSSSFDKNAIDQFLNNINNQ